VARRDRESLFPTSTSYPTFYGDRWSAERSDGDLLFFLDPPSVPLSGWHIFVRYEAFSFWRATPPPNEQRAPGTLAWRFAADAHQGRLRLRFTPPPLTKFMFSLGGLGGRAVQSGSYFLLGMILPLLVLVLFKRWAPTSAREERRLLLQAAAWSLAVTAILIAYFQLIYTLFPSSLHARLLLRVLIPLVVAVVLLGAFSLTQMWPSSIVRAVAVVGAVLAAGLIAVLSPQPDTALDGTMPLNTFPRWLPWALLVGVMSMTAALALAGVAGVVVRAFGRMHVSAMTAASKLRWWAILAVVAVSVCTVGQWFGTIVAIFRLPGSNRPSDQYELAAQFMMGLATSLVSLFPYMVAVAICALLYAQAASGSHVFLLPTEHWVATLLALLYAALVASPLSFLLGVNEPLQFILTFVLLRFLAFKQTFPRIATQITALNPQLDPALLSMAAQRAEMIDRGIQVARLQKRMRTLYEDQAADKMDFSEFRTKSDQAADQVTRLTSGVEAVVLDLGSGPQYVTAADPIAAATLTARPLVRLPDHVEPRHLALGAGPEDRWWANGVQAARIGAWVALLPVGYYVYVLATQRGVRLLSPHTPFGALQLVIGLADEIAFWLVAAFVLGCLWAHLPSWNGIWKALSLTAVYFVAVAADVLVRQWLGINVDVGWTFRVFELLLFLTAVGVSMDWRSVQKLGLHWRALLDLYHFTEARSVITYSVPVAIGVVAIAQQLLSGNAREAILEFIRRLPDVAK